MKTEEITRIESEYFKLEKQRKSSPKNMVTCSIVFLVYWQVSIRTNRSLEGMISYSYSVYERVSEKKLGVGIKNNCFVRT